MEELELKELNDESLFELLNAFEGLNESLDEIEGDIENEDE